MCYTSSITNMHTTSCTGTDCESQIGISSYTESFWWALSLSLQLLPHHVPLRSKHLTVAWTAFVCSLLLLVWQGKNALLQIAFIHCCTEIHQSRKNAKEGPLFCCSHHSRIHLPNVDSPELHASSHSSILWDHSDRV